MQQAFFSFSSEHHLEMYVAHNTDRKAIILGSCNEKSREWRDTVAETLVAILFFAVFGLLPQLLISA
jgi:hypothetical protein